MKTSLGPALLSLLACVGSAEAQEKTPATPGAHILFAEISRDTQQGFEMVHYALRAEGLPKDQRFAVYSRWMDGSSKEAARGLRLDEAGNVRDEKGEAFTVSLGQVFPGEYVAFALVSEDGKSKAFGEITLHPIEAEGKGGCRLAVRADHASHAGLGATAAATATARRPARRHLYAGGAGDRPGRMGPER